MQLRSLWTSRTKWAWAMGVELTWQRGQMGDLTDVTMHCMWRKGGLR